MKCLEKNRDNRYKTADALAKDLQRYLRSAKPPRVLTYGIAAIVLLAAIVWGLKGRPGKVDPSGNTGQVTPSTTNREPSTQPPIHVPQPGSQGQSSVTADEITPEKRESSTNKMIYLKARAADEAPTFEGAQVILDQIDVSQISDPDLASYVAISKKIADFCPKVGIPRSANPSLSGIMKDIDLAALASQAIQNPLETLKTGREIKKQLPIYDKLSESLNARYGQG
jgi:hypothetical protein